MIPAALDTVQYWAAVGGGVVIGGSIGAIAWRLIHDLEQRLFGGAA